MKTFSAHAFSLRQLQYALAIADTGGFRKAALRCGVSQPSLSAQLAQLEETLGVQLFERSRSKVLVTSAGELLLPRFRALVSGADQLVDAASLLLDPLSGSLRLGVIPTVSPYLLPDLAPHVPATLQVEWVEDKTETLVRELEDGSLDGALLALEADLGNVEREVVGFDPFVLAFGREHPVARRRRRVTTHELLELDVLLLDDGHCLRDQSLEVCSASRELAYRATSLATLVPMVARGQGVTLLPAMSLPLENRRDMLSVRRFRNPPPGRTIGMVWRKSSAREPAIHAVAEAAKHALHTVLRTER